MKNLFFCIVAVCFIVSCDSRKQQAGSSLTEKRAKTDTTLVFQGIRISEPLDSAKYADLMNSCPITLYDRTKGAYVFTEILINEESNLAYQGEVVHSLCLKGQIDKFYNYLSFIGLYEDKYGCFSYYQRLNQNDEKMGSFFIGKESQQSGKAWTRQDAINDFLEYAQSDTYQFFFVWEWKNQKIVLYFNPKLMQLNSSVTYYDTGYELRHAEEETQKMLKDAEERKIEEARSQQQI